MIEESNNLRLLSIYLSTRAARVSVMEYSKIADNYQYESRVNDKAYHDDRVPVIEPPFSPYDDCNNNSHLS